MPASDRAARILSEVSYLPPSSPSAASRRFSVATDTPDRCARSLCDQPSSARTASGELPGLCEVIPCPA